MKICSDISTMQCLLEKEKAQSEEMRSKLGEKNHKLELLEKDVKLTREREMRRNFQMKNHEYELEPELRNSMLKIVC